MKEHPRSDITTAEELIEEEIAELESNTVHHWTTWLLAFGALVVLSAVLGIFFFTNKSADRGPKTSSGLAVLTLAEPQGQAIGAPSRFRWERYPGASRYVVMVTEDRSGRTVLARSTAENSLEPTTEESASFTPGLYAWSVEAQNAAETALAQGEGAFVLAAAS